MNYGIKTLSEDVRYEVRGVEYFVRRADRRTIHKGGLEAVSGRKRNNCQKPAFIDAEFEKQQQEYVRREVERAAGLTVSISSGTVKKTSKGSQTAKKTAVKAPEKAAARRPVRKA